MLTINKGDGNFMQTYKHTYSRQAILSFIYFSDVIKILVPDDKTKTDWKLRKRRRIKKHSNKTSNIIIELHIMLNTYSYTEIKKKRDRDMHCIASHSYI